MLSKPQAEAIVENFTSGGFASVYWAGLKAHRLLLAIVVCHDFFHCGPLLEAIHSEERCRSKWERSRNRETLDLEVMSFRKMARLAGLQIVSGKLKPTAHAVNWPLMVCLHAALLQL